MAWNLSLYRHACVSRILEFLFAVWFVGSAAWGADSAAVSKLQALMQEAGEAAAAGEPARQFARLREAVRLAPDFEPARWQLGQIEVDGEWLSVEESQRRAASNSAQAEYRELRVKYGASAAGQVALARWCRNHGLEDEARFHWANVLSASPSHREALRALDLRWRDGALVASDEADSLRQQAGAARRASKAWASQVARWERSVMGEGGAPSAAVLEEIRGVDDVTAIAAFEAKTLAGNWADEAKGRRPQPRRLLSVAFVAALDSMSEHAATESLVRHAVLAPFAEVRYAATNALRERPLHDFVPILLDGLAMPVGSQFQVVTDAQGSVHYLHTLYREGSHTDQARRVSRAAWQPFTAAQRAIGPMEIAQQTADEVTANVTSPQPTQRDAANAQRAAIRTTARAARYSLQFAQEATAIEREVATLNASAEALNARIIPVLANVSGEDFGLKPRDWWNWWTNYNDYELPEDRPVYETNDVTNVYIPPPPSCECFVRGTMVWTKTGQRPIETLELGDLVLAQDVNTGQLAYKPVIGRTVRPPTPILEFSLGGEKLLSTRGHPLWVAGVGWRMAKELGDGAVLHSIAGGVRVDSYAEVANAEAFNLIVADFNTYFVGENGILVHDNTPRQPTRAKVPGLAR